MQVMLSDINVAAIPERPELVQEVLDQRWEAMDLGMGLARSNCVEVPTASALLGEVMEKLGCDPSAYRLYRYTQSYPVVQSVSILWFELSTA